MSFSFDVITSIKSMESMGRILKRLSLAKEDLTVDTKRLEKKSKTATIIEEPSDELHEKHGRRYGRRYLAFSSGWTALGCIDPNDKNILPLSKI